MGPPSFSTTGEIEVLPLVLENIGVASIPFNANKPSKTIHRAALFIVFLLVLVSRDSLGRSIWKAVRISLLPRQARASIFQNGKKRWTIKTKSVKRNFKSKNCCRKVEDAYLPDIPIDSL